MTVDFVNLTHKVKGKKGKSWCFVSLSILAVIFGRSCFSFLFFLFAFPSCLSVITAYTFSFPHLF